MNRAAATRGRTPGGLAMTVFKALRLYPGSMKPSRRVLHTAAFVAGLIAVSIFIFPVSLFSQTSTFVAPGRIEGAAPALAIGTAATGTVSELLVRDGSRVTAGQILVKLDCRPIEADMRSREAGLAAAQAAYDRTRNGPRPDEIAVGEAIVGYSQARAEEAQKALERTLALQEGVTVTAARVLEVKRDARITAAQLEEARARLSLLRAGSREEDIRRSEALRNAAAAERDAARARLEQCSVRAPVDGVVLDVLVGQGQFLSLAVPQPLLHLVADGPLRVRAEVALRDLVHVCTAQSAVVSAEFSPTAVLHAKVAAIGPAANPRSLAAATADNRDTDAIPVILTIEHDAPALPIGASVMVRFEPCPSKT